jgi:hypothetical protein
VIAFDGAKLMWENVVQSPATAPENLIAFDGAKLTWENVVQSPATAQENLLMARY